MNSSGAVVQQTNYYPSGTVMAESQARGDQGVQPYKFNGKELDRTKGLDFYDYEARQFDPVLMRFTRPDPLQEKYYSISPYAYCLNNPVRFVDPDGRNPITAIRAVHRSYKAYKAYQAAQKAAVVTTAVTTTAVATNYSYNYFVDGDKSEEVLNSLLGRANIASSPEYNNQRKREGDARDKRNQEQANVQQTVINGGHNPKDPGGDFNPNNPDPKTVLKVVAGATAGGILLEQIEANGDSKQTPSQQQQTQQPEQQTQTPSQQSEPSIWDRIRTFLNF
jgi:RHS repeat-associated protein